MEQAIERSSLAPWVIDAPPIEGIGVVVICPEGWGGALLTVTLGCGTVNPTTAPLQGIECKPRRVQYEYRLVEPSIFINVLDVDIPRPCYLHVDVLATRGTSSKAASMVVGVSEPGPIVIGLPYSIYKPLYLG
jgi:hypothetical protein